MAAQTPDGAPIDLAENKKRMLRGDLYYAFTPDLAQDRKECVRACRKLNTAVEPTRRELVGIWRECVLIYPFFYLHVDLYMRLCFFLYSHCYLELFIVCFDMRSRLITYF